MELAQVVGTSIDSTWVLNGITSVAAFLFWTQLKEIKESIKSITNMVQEHDKEIALLKKEHDAREDEFFDKLELMIEAKMRYIKGDD